MSESVDSFLSNSFYSSSGSDSNQHLHKLRDSIQFKHSISSRSINAALNGPSTARNLSKNGSAAPAAAKSIVDASPTTPTLTAVVDEPVSENDAAPQKESTARRTIYMKNSPSMKMLEGILNEKTKSDSFATISEEQETENDATDVDAVPAEKLTHLPIDNDSINDKSSETADLGLKTPASDTEQSTVVPSVVDHGDKDLSPSLHSGASSVSPMNNFNHPSDHSDVVQTPRSAGQSTVNQGNISSVSVTSFATAHEEDEETKETKIVQELSKSAANNDNILFESPGSTMDGRGYSTNEETPVLAAPAVFQTMKSSDNVKTLIKSVDRVDGQTSQSEQPLSKTETVGKSPNPLATGLLNPLPLTKSHIHNSAKSIPTSQQKPLLTHKATPSLAPETPKQQVYRPRAIAEMHPIARSPSTPVQGNRFPSDSSLSTTNSKPPLSPNKHKRSSTLSDISKFTAPKKEKTSKEKKRFSFKAFFKSKPSEIKSKSYSSPNLAELQKPDRSNNNVSKGPLAESSESLQPQSQRKLNKSKSNSTFMSVFKKNRSSDNLTSLTPHTNQTEQFPPQSLTLNSIREIVDSPRADRRKSTQTASEFLFPLKNEKRKEMEEFQYDDDNLISNPPINRMNGGYGEEIQLIPELPEIETTKEKKSENISSQTQNKSDVDGTLHEKKPSQFSNDTIFGSPLLPESETQKQSKRKSEQLIGDSLFPKHLDAHEVDSIVSLERSRSIKSIKSNKRSSFVNYDGGDENIVHYQGRLSIPSRNASMTRSNSILKNSSRSLNINSIDNTIDFSNENAIESTSKSGSSAALVAVNSSEDVLNFGDLMDFADFIDADNFSISESPKLNAFPIKAEVEERPLTDNSKIVNNVNNFVNEESKSNGQSPPLTKMESPVSSSNTPKKHKIRISPPNSATSNGQTRAARSFSLSDKSGQFNSVGRNESSEQLVLGNKPDNSSTVSKDKTSPNLLSALDTDGKYLDSADDEPTKLQSPSPMELDTYSPDHVTPNSGYDSEPLGDLVGMKKVEEKDDDTNAIHLEQSPILENAYRTVGTSPSLDKQGKFVRPISMSFRGLKPPSFGGKLKNANLRSSDSHQSFTLSMDDDTDYSGNGIGGGFGTSSDEDDDEDDDDDDDDDFDDDEDISETEDIHDAHIGNRDGYTYNSARLQEKNDHFNSSHNSNYGESNRFSFAPPPVNGGRFSQNKFPSFSDTSANSSPKSLSSFVLKTTNFFKSGSTPKVMSTMSNVQSHGVRFSSRIILYDTYNPEEYDRHPDTATCNQLTPLLAQKIKDELNSFKAEMEIHRDSQCYTHFF